VKGAIPAAGWTTAKAEMSTELGAQNSANRTTHTRA
jgi:hypothetical protein